LEYLLTFLEALREEINQRTISTILSKGSSIVEALRHQPQKKLLKPPRHDSPLAEAGLHKNKSLVGKVCESLWKC